MKDQFPYLLAFQRIDRLTGRKIREILAAWHGDAAAAWQAGPNWPELGNHFSPKGLAEIAKVYHATDPVKLYEEYLASGCSVTMLGEEDYPSLLAKIYDPPLMLFYYGKLPEPKDICIAMIGSRNYTYYGKQVAEIFSRDLAAQGMVVVSGMARGIDSFCHKGALAAGGRTIAVLGSGLDVIYPRENAGLYREIIASGAVVSEFPLGTEALPRHFPQRNRIISGLSQGLLVVEAGEKSGTMLTVDYALEQGRDVFAVPGPIISPTSKGTNRLLKQGAKIALSPEDVWSEYFTEPLRPVKIQKQQGAQPSPQVSDTEKLLLKRLMTPMRPDDILAQQEITLSAQELSALLTMLEIRGLVKQLPGNYYQTVVKTIYA